MAAKMYPSMMLEGLFTAKLMDDALSFDVSPDTHSLSFYVESPTDVRNLFDSITFNKCKNV